MPHALSHASDGAPATFGRWLLRQADRGDAIGDLAKCAASDPGFPRDGSADAVSCRLNTVGADGDLHAALEDAELAWSTN